MRMPYRWVGDSLLDGPLRLPKPPMPPAGPALALNEVPPYFVSSTEAAQVAGAASIARTPAVSPTIAIRVGIRRDSFAATMTMIETAPTASRAVRAQGRKPL